MAPVLAAFVPRKTFHAIDSLPRSYFLGHHSAGLKKMKSMLSEINLVIECRDYRVPFTSRNPLFEENLAGRERLVVYTKQDLGSRGQHQDRKAERIIQDWHHPSTVLFTNHKDHRSVRKVLQFAQNHAKPRDSLIGSRIMVVGMPNVGKSSLLNALRHSGVRKGKAASTGDQPGVTRKIGTMVKIAEGNDKSETVYVADTPGVFIPYVPDAESMLKLALCGSVKDTIIAPDILADYLLYHINLFDPEVYTEYSTPTNDVHEFLAAVARRTGRLGKGGSPNEEAAALWIIQRWRNGDLGQFLLDEVNQSSLNQEQMNGKVIGASLNQARRTDKELRRERSKRAHMDAG